MYLPLKAKDDSDSICRRRRLLVLRLDLGVGEPPEYLREDRDDHADWVVVDEDVDVDARITGTRSEGPKAHKLYVVEGVTGVKIGMTIKARRRYLALRSSYGQGISKSV